MPRRPPSFWIACAAAVLCLVFWGLAAGTIFRSTGQARNFGYWLERYGAELRVGAVIPRGPADGKLHPGDTLLAIDGDRRASTAGVVGLLNLPRGATYTATVNRRGIVRDVQLAVRFGTRQAPWWGIVSCLVSALAGIAMGALIALAGPPTRTVRSAAAFLFLSACIALHVALNQAVLQGIYLVLFGILGILGNLAQIAGYECASVFPTAVQEGRVWKALRALVWVVGLFCWLLLLPSALQFGLGPDLGVSFYARFYSLSDSAALLWARVFPVRGIVLTLAVSAVLVRNYLRLPDQGQRRRIRLVVSGALLALLPEFVLQAAFATRKLIGVGINPIGPVMDLDMALAPLVTTALAPLLAYAILKHRVFGIEIVIRRGLRYLFAKRALQTLLVLPALVLAIRIAARPAVPVRDALLGDWWFVVLIAASAVALRFRGTIFAALDRRFFRETYNRERILSELIEHVRSCGWSPEIEPSVCGRIEGALHPERVLFLRRAEERDELEIGYSSESPANVPGNGALLRWIEACSHSQPVSHMDHTPAETVTAWLRQARIDLVVPIHGTGGAGLGALLLGGKKSEEPYSATDRALLEAIAAQLGIVLENQRLKQSVDREKHTRLQVLARVSDAGIDLLRECPACGACFGGQAERCPGDQHELTLTLPVERVLDAKYRLDRRIGAGGMGAVYQAWDLRLNRPIAVKIMVGGLFGNQVALLRFEREARTAARLNHPNIVAVYDFAAIGGGAYLVMELIEGRSLRAELDATGPLPPRRAAGWFDQLLAGLSAAHQAGVVHRDLKPANILIARPADGQEQIKIADFGLARLKAAEPGDNVTLTATGAVLGTLGYMSSEQLLGRDADERSDLFSVAVLTIESLTGRRPFTGRSPQELLAALNQPVPLLPGDGREVRRLNAILAACLAGDPAARPASAAELRPELTAALQDCPPLALTHEAGVSPDAKTETG